MLYSGIEKICLGEVGVWEGMIALSLGRMGLGSNVLLRCWRERVPSHGAVLQIKMIITGEDLSQTKEVKIYRDSGWTHMERLSKIQRCYAPRLNQERNFSQQF